jgi:cation diffusion facilitator family transporter
MDSRLKYPILLSVLAAVLTVALKGGAYALTGSVGLLSDAVESLVNLVAALTAYLSLLYASKPVDRSHTYGHEKIEFFSSGLEGLLIVAAAGGIAWYAVRRLIQPEPLQPLGAGLLLAFLGGLINAAVAVVLLRAGRRHNSIVLEADGRHLLTDVWTGAAVLVGVGLVWLTGLERLDPLAALLVSVHILITGLDLVRRSFNGLMDHALPANEQAAVRAAIEAQLSPDMAYHALRTRQAGSRRFADFHLLVPGCLTVRQAHAFTEQIEQAVRAALPGLEVTVHIEPIEEQAAWEDSELLAVERGKDPARPRDAGTRGP